MAKVKPEGKRIAIKMLKSPASYGLDQTVRKMRMQEAKDSILS